MYFWWAFFGATGCGRFVVVVVVVVEGDDGIVVVAMLVTAFVGVSIKIVLGVLKLSVSCVVVVVVVNTITIPTSVKYPTISTISTTTPPLSIPTWHSIHLTIALL